MLQIGTSGNDAYTKILNYISKAVVMIKNLHINFGNALNNCTKNNATQWWSSHYCHKV